MWGLPDKNAEGAEGDNSLKISRFFWREEGVVIEVVVRECIVSRSVIVFVQF